MTYGTLINCGYCKRKGVPLHCRINKKKPACQACYAKWRRKDPVKRAKLYAQIRAYQLRNKERVYAYNREYSRKRRTKANG